MDVLDKKKTYDEVGGEKRNFWYVELSQGWNHIF